MNLKTWRLVGFALVLLPISLFAQTTTPTPLTIDETENSIRVDAHLNEWPAARMLVLNEKSQVIYGRNYWKGEDDFSARVFITYDSEFLYLAAVVTKTGGVLGVNDKNPSDKANLWNGDCLEVFLSTKPVTPDHKRLLKGDYHIGLAPGSGCKNPQIYCFNKGTDILGARLAARTTRKGYLMEARIPLTFFEGLEVAQGNEFGFNVILDKGGFGGYRSVEMDFSGHAASSEDPSCWNNFQWIGKTVVSVPGNQAPNYAESTLKDGTQGANFLGLKNIRGKVVDPQGKPLAGAKVSTWPRTLETSTDAAGEFSLKRIKFYDPMLVYARRDGYAASLSRLDRQGTAVVTLWKLPQSFDLLNDQVSTFFYGQSVQIPAKGDLAAAVTGTEGLVRPLQLNVLRLGGTEALGSSSDAAYPALDGFVAYARSVGAEPVIEVPIHRSDPAGVAEWVKYCNIQKKYGIRFWTIGDEPDLYSRKSGDPDLKDYGLNDYANDFRTIYNAMKLVDPSIFIAGPELGSKYASGEDDWLSSFIQSAGDIVNLVSVHHYAAMKAGDCTSRTIQDDMRRESALLQEMKDRIAQNSDVYIPLVVTGGNVCAEATTQKAPKDAGPGSFWAALWEANEMGTYLKEGVSLNAFSYLVGNGPLDALADGHPRPDYWAEKLVGPFLRGKPVPAQIQQGDIAVYATQDPTSRDVSLLILNNGDRWIRIKILLNGKDTDLSVDAGLDQKFEYEIPGLSINCLKLKAKKSTDEVTVYSLKMALAGKEPQVSTIKPW